MRNFFYRIALPIAVLYSMTIAVDFLSKPSTFHVILGMIAIGTNAFLILTFISSLNNCFTIIQTKETQNEQE